MRALLRTVMAALAILALMSAGPADAAKRKRQKVRVHSPAATMPMKPAAARPRGPSWAGPNECYTDEGYGRYVSCSGGMDM